MNKEREFNTRLSKLLVDNKIAFNFALSQW